MPDGFDARNLADSNYRLLNGYIAFLKKRKAGASEPGASVSVDQFVDEANGRNVDELPNLGPTDSSTS